MRLLVIGGSGYLGRHIMRAGLRQGLNVASFSRSGAPPAAVSTDGLSGAEWLSGSAESEADVAKAVEGANAVVSCLGTPFGTRESILRINGDANVAITKAAKAAGVERYVFVSAATFRPMEQMFPDSWGAYFEGKRAAADAVAEHFGDAGAVLKVVHRQASNAGVGTLTMVLCVPRRLPTHPLFGRIVSHRSPASSTRRASPKRASKRASASRKLRCQMSWGHRSPSSSAPRLCSGPRSKWDPSATCLRLQAAWRT